MAERDAMQKRYAYNEMSNKVQQADRSLLHRPRLEEGTGEVESLANRGNIGRMGDRMVGGGAGVAASNDPSRRRPTEVKEMMERAEKKRRKRESHNPGAAAAGGGLGAAGPADPLGNTPNLAGGGGPSLLDMMEGGSGGAQLMGYRPSTSRARAGYDSLLTLLGTRAFLGNQPSSVLRDAAEEVAATLKDQALRDPDRQRVLSKLLMAGGKTGGLSNDHFANLVKLGKELDDFQDYSDRKFGVVKEGANNADDKETGNNDTGNDTMAVDEEMGVAVVFDDSDEEGGEEREGRAADQDEDDVDEDQVVEVAESSDEDQGEPDDADSNSKKRKRADENEGEKEQDNEGGNDEDDEDEKIVQGKGDDNNDHDDHDDDRAASKSRRSKHRGDRILSVHEIDAHYLQRQLSSHYDDADVAAKIADDVLQVLDIRTPRDVRECENRLLVLLGFELFDLIRLLLKNRVKIWACVLLKRARNDSERDEIEAALQKLAQDGDEEGDAVWKEIHSKSTTQDWSRERMKRIMTNADSLGGGAAGTKTAEGAGDVLKAIDAIGMKKTQGANAEDDNDKDASAIDAAGKRENASAVELDLDSLAFRDGSHTMTNKKCDLPDKSWRATRKGYEEVHVPGVKGTMSPDEKLIPIADLPPWTHDAFQGMKRLNRIQSKMCEVALRTSENLLLCAPTGAGKTNVAMLTILNILGRYRKKTNDDATNNEDMYDLSAFKMVYVAPMKALVQEVVKGFKKRLEKYGIQVKELSGDSSLTRQQISETQILVTTPEKWDIVTRQGEGRAYTQLVRLVIIDEIHLLHDGRGPVLESIVARIIRQVETTAEPVRLVGLSATLPNYADVATFLRVKPDRGLFFFDHSFRPVPLQMQYIGISERNAFKRFQLQNEVCYEKVVAQRRNNYQMLIFVHSRAETGKTAKALRDMALEKDELSYFVRQGGATEEILREELGTVTNADLKEVLTYGFGIHHAGMNRADRELVEDLFNDGHIAVLCCTATLAWGVNLPAHTVIIKGTQIYDPAKGRWAELSPLDVLQMLGRAGRPQHDVEGEGIIMTAHSELQFYLSLTNLQLSVESQLVKVLPDHLNAEVVLGTVQTIAEAADWLSYTFLYIRMLQNPALYGIHQPEQTLKEDPTLKRRRLDLAHTAAYLLEKSQLVRYDRRSGSLQSTPLGRVASQYYISHSSMAMYSRHLRSNMSDIELLRLFAMSGEFAHITVREEEKLELNKLAQKVPVPVKESPTEPSAKVNMLLQAYISRLKLEGFALVSDMAFIQLSAGRIMRALFEIALRRNWSGVSKLTLAFANMVVHRIWRSQSPLRQFKNVPDFVARKLERKSDIEWSRYADLTPSDLGELVGGAPKMGTRLHQLIHQFPRLELSARVQPITRSMLRVDLTLVPDFQYDVKVHGYVQLFHILVEDVNGDRVLHHELFSLKSSSAEEEHSVVFTVPVLEPLPPVYFIRVLSDRWLHSEAVLPISFNSLILPPKFPPPTELLDLQPLPPSALGEAAFIKLYDFKEFNPIQTQTFHELFKTDNNALICAPSSSGKTACAEFAVMRMLVSDPQGKCVFVAPKEEVVDQVYRDWKTRFGSILKAGQVVKLSGETAPDLRLLSEGKICVCSVRHWDSLSRRWKQRKAVQAVTLFIVDELHLLGAEEGPTVEVVISRMRFLSSQKLQRSSKLRIVGLGASLANAREVAEWMGVPSKSLFNFSSKVRPTPLEIYIQSFDQANFSTRLMAMAKPVYNSVVRHSDGQPVLVFVPSRRQAQLTAIDLMTYHASIEDATFLGKNAQVDVEKIVPTLREPSLQQVVSAGVGFVHDGMLSSDWQAVVDLYRKGVVRVLVCPAELAWKTEEYAHLVVVMDTVSYDGREQRYVDYPIADLLHMIGRASRHTDPNGKCVIFCQTPKKEYLKKLLYDPLPIESHLDHYLHDHFNSEIVTKTIGNMQDAVDYITWTFLYRRLTKNPNYYNLQGTSNLHLSEHISEMVETVLGNLEESKCCQMSEEGEVSPLNLGMVAAYYYVQYTTIELVASSIDAKTKTRGVMEILSAASEFGSLAIRQGEDKTLRILAKNLPHQLPESAQFHDSNTKALILLQCHFGRTSLSTDLRNDQKTVLARSVNLIQAIVDVISSNGWLKPALAAMELSQMVVQGLWNKDHVLMQIPHFTKEIIARCEAHEGEDAIDSVFDILTLDDDVRNDILKLPDDKMADVAVFCNNYPSVDVAFEVKDAEDVTAGEPVQVVVTLAREVDEDELDEDERSKLGIVSAPLFPKEKKEGWWIVVGDTKTNALHSLKRVSLQQTQKVLLEFLAPEEAGDYNLTLFCMSDSYLGCDQEFEMNLNVGAGESDDDDDDNEDDDESEAEDKMDES